jgi:hypothetical protein
MQVNAASRAAVTIFFVFFIIK